MEKREMRKNFRSFLFVLVLILIVLAVISCRGNAPAPAPKTALTDQFKVAYLAAAQNYKEFVQLESKISNDYQKWEENRSNRMAGAGDNLTLVNQCWTDTTTALTQAASAVFSKDVNGNPVSPTAENKAFINALGTGTGFYAGNTDRCQQAALDLMSYVRVNREKDAADRNLFLDEWRVYKTKMIESPEAATITRFYNQYGPTLGQVLQAGEQALLDKLVAEADPSLKSLPYDFIGFPTGALSVRTGSMKICNEFNAIYTGEKPAPRFGTASRNKELYLVEYNAAGGCRLLRRSAWDYMDRLFVTGLAGEQYDTSTDTGTFGQFGKTPSPAPTAAPKP